MKRKSGPLISVIIPAYNAETTIERSVLSALNQKIDGSLEVIVVNDCSSDGTSSVLDRLPESERSLKVIHHKYNLGVSAARNSAIAACPRRVVGLPRCLTIILATNILATLSRI